MEPERKIEKVLRAYAQKRRADAGDPLKLHPGTRQRLQAEVSRRTNKPGAEDASLSLLQLFRQQWAFLLGFAFMIFLGATLLLPTLRSAKREAQSISTMNNLHQIGTAAEIVAGQNNGRLPSSLDALTNEFLPSQVLTDPASGKRFVYAAAGDNLNELQSNNIIAYSPLSRDGSAVLFADGRVEFANRARFSELTNQKNVQFALADKTGSGQTARLSYASASAAVAPPAQLPAAGETRGQPGVHGSQLFVQNGPASGQQNRYRNEAVSAQTMPVLQSFQLLQNGDSISVVDQDGSIYQGSVQVAAVMKENEAATVEAPAKAAEEKKDETKENQAAGIQQQSIQNYTFRVTGMNRTLKQNVVFSGSMETAPGVRRYFGGGGGGGGIGGTFEPAQTNSQATADQQQGVLSNSRVVGTAVIGPTNHISVNAVPVSP